MRDARLEFGDVADRVAFECHDHVLGLQLPGCGAPGGDRLYEDARDRRQSVHFRVFRGCVRDTHAHSRSLHVPILYQVFHDAPREVDRDREAVALIHARFRRDG